MLKNSQECPHDPNQNPEMAVVLLLRVHQRSERSVVTAADQNGGRMLSFLPLRSDGHKLTLKSRFTESVTHRLPVVSSCLFVIILILFHAIFSYSLHAGRDNETLLRPGESSFQNELESDEKTTLCSSSHQVSLSES